MATQTISNFQYNPNAQFLFNRTYSLAIGAPGQTSAIRLSNLSYTANGLTQPASPFRVAFDIDKNLFGASPNKSKVEVWNLAYQNRTKIKAGFLVQLQAGYRGLMDTVFLGNISALQGVKNERHGPDVTTTFECGEGESVIVMSRLDKSYPPGTSLTQVINDVAAAMAVTSVITDQGVGNGGFQGIPATTFGRGLTIHGSCRDTLDKLLKNAGLRWSVQNGNLVILPVSSTTNAERAIVVSSGVVVDQAGVSSFNPARATGLIGVPSVGQNFVSFKTLLNPNIKPGALVQLQCEDTSLNGFYKVNRAHYVGDTHDANKWYIECETTVAQPSQGTIL